MSVWTVVDAVRVSGPPATDSGATGPLVCPLSLGPALAADDLCIVVASFTRDGPVHAPAGYQEIPEPFGGDCVLYARYLDGTETEVEVIFAGAGFATLGTVVLRGACLAEFDRVDAVNLLGGPTTEDTTLVEDGGALTVLVRPGIGPEVTPTPPAGWTALWDSWGVDMVDQIYTVLAYRTQAGPSTVVGGNWDPFDVWETRTVGLNAVGLHTEPISVDVTTFGAATPTPGGYEETIPLPEALPDELFPPTPTHLDPPMETWRDRGPGIPRRPS